MSYITKTYLEIQFKNFAEKIKSLLNNKVDKVEGKGLSTNDLTSELKSNYDTAYDHSQSAHARTDATKVESSTTNGNIKINGTETTVYTHPSGSNPHGTTKSDIGLGNVGNFKAVSTVANQGLSDTEKSNARANIGAGTSSFSGSYNDLSDKPSIPTVGNGTITIKQAGTSKGTFTMNQSGNATIELTDTTYGVATSSALGLVKSGTDITVDSNGNVSVNDDSHNHVISNVDGLQSALDGKQNIRNGTVGVVDWNTLVKPGTYKIQGSTMTSDYNTPVGEYQYGILLVLDSEGNTGEHRLMQIYFPHQPHVNYIWFRMNNSGNGYGAWTSWKGLSQNADMLDGKHASDFALSGHTHSYLPLSGGTMTGALNFANNTWNVVGDDVAIGDHNVTGSLGVKGLNSTPRVSLLNSSGTVLSSIGSDTSGEVYSANNFNVKGTTMKLNNGSASIVYNSTTESIDFVFS